MIIGKKVTLRPLKIEDAPYTLELRYDWEANKLMMGYQFPVNLENEKEWINQLYPKGERNRIYLAIEENKIKKFVGYMSLKNINYINGTGDFGIILLKRFRNKGYAKEGIILFYRYLYEEIYLRKITLYVLEENEIAINAYKKIGYKQEGLLKEHVFQNGKYKNVVVMSLFLKDLKFEK